MRFDDGVGGIVVCAADLRLHIQRQRARDGDSAQIYAVFYDGNDFLFCADDAAERICGVEPGKDLYFSGVSAESDLADPFVFCAAVCFRGVGRLLQRGDRGHHGGHRNGDDIFLYAAAHFAKERAGSFAREGTGHKRREIVFEEKPHNFS